MELNIDEALRYLGAGENASADLREKMLQCAKRLKLALEPRYVYRVFSLTHEKDGAILNEAEIFLSGNTAHKMLEDCSGAALLACTLGAGFDSLLRTEQARDMSSAVMLDACASAWIEAFCDEAERELSSKFPSLYLSDRFSPGYGDLPLCLQREICAALDAQKRLGIYVSESFLLNPVKTVTAVIGLSSKPQMARIKGCAFCSMNNSCALRKGGKHCAF